MNDTCTSRDFPPETISTKCPGEKELGAHRADLLLVGAGQLDPLLLRHAVQDASHLGVRQRSASVGVNQLERLPQLRVRKFSSHFVLCLVCGRPTVLGMEFGAVCLPRRVRGVAA